MFWLADLLLDEHAGDDESVQAQEAVQDVTQPRVVQRHRLCEGRRSQVTHLQCVLLMEYFHFQSFFDAEQAIR